MELLPRRPKTGAVGLRGGDSKRKAWLDDVDGLGRDVGHRGTRLFPAEQHRRRLRASRCACPGPDRAGDAARGGARTDAATEHSRRMARASRVALSERRVDHAGRFAGTVAGLWVLVALSSSHLNLLIGVSTIAAAPVTLAMHSSRAAASISRLAWSPA
jgi:hypothetical protein